VGSGSSYHVTGHSKSHQKLEKALAEFVGYPKAMVFSTGYLANLGAIVALCDGSTHIFADKKNHASLMDGMVLSRATFSRFSGDDLDALETQLHESKAERKLIITESVFSMEGNMAPLDRLAALAKTHHAWLYVDDAHGFGVFGMEGRGTVNHFGLSSRQAPVMMGTLGKAFGGYGAFIAASENTIDYLIQTARPYLFTTATPPACATAALKALELTQTEVGNELRTQLFDNICLFRELAQEAGLTLLPSTSPIQIIMVGDEEKAQKIWIGIADPRHGNGLALGY